MADAADNLLWAGLSDVSKETSAHLGERAFCFVHLYNDWLDICGTFAIAYSQDLPQTSLVAADFFSLGKELHWLHRLLHWGNYPLISRTLRYNWELMFRAYYADVYQPSVPGDADLPGSSVDEKVEWLESRGPGLHFHSLIVPILNVLVPDREHKLYKGYWRELNQHVHPTKDLRYRMVEESALAVRDGFDQQWAESTINLACEVYDLIWLMTLHRFPKCVSLLTGPKMFMMSPKTTRILRELPRS